MIEIIYICASKEITQAKSEMHFFFFKEGKKTFIFQQGKKVRLWKNWLAKIFKVKSCKLRRLPNLH